MLFLRSFVSHDAFEKGNELPNLHYLRRVMVDRQGKFGIK